MSQTQILHLSDMHTRCDVQFDYSVVLDPLVSRLRKDRDERGLRPELLILSGDIAWSGNKDEYELAHEFLSKVCSELDISKDAVFIVPGNHDVDRDEYTIAEQTKTFQYENMRELNQDIENKKSRKHLFRGLGRYSDFINENYSHLEGTHDALFPYVLTYATSEGKILALMGLNSAWLSRYSPDKEKVAIGQYQVVMALEALKEKGDFDLGFVNYHHPRTWLWREDRTLFLSRINMHWERL